MISTSENNGRLIIKILPDEETRDYKDNVIRLPKSAMSKVDDLAEKIGQSRGKTAAMLIEFAYGKVEIRNKAADGQE